MSSRGPQRTLHIKRTDGELITREDLQFDLLQTIFHDTQKVFTDPNTTLAGDPAGTKVTFRDLYANYILNSPKASRLLREKMLDVPQFGTDFAKIALLTNVGRVPSTMAFFPEMKTSLRTYHPIPALQSTSGNLQDVPRIKHILKSCQLEDEGKIQPSTLHDILARARAGHIPSTNVMNLISVMVNHTVSVSQAHFPPELDFLDLFLPSRISSASRARAFLWLCYHYLEGPNSNGDKDNHDAGGTTNPFSDPRDSAKMPDLLFLTAEDPEENVTPGPEKLLADKLMAQRNAFVKIQAEKESKDSAKTASLNVEEDEEIAEEDVAKLKGKRGGTVAKSKTSAKKKRVAEEKLRRGRQKAEPTERATLTPAFSVLDYDRLGGHPVKRFSGPVLPILQNQYPQHEYQYRPPQPPLLPPYRRVSTLTPEPRNPHPRRFSPYMLSPISTPAYPYKTRAIPHPVVQSVSMPQRSMLKHTWHVVTHTDPLQDSDDELGDDHVRHDYAQRLRIISRLRGKSPSPEPVSRPVGTGVDPNKCNLMFPRNAPIIED